jgi:TonB-linked SusC/RagA family outer membrane protein
MKFYTEFLCRYKSCINSKLLLKIKLSIILLVTIGLQASFAAIAQEITIIYKKASLEQVFKEIHRQNGCNFIYDVDMLSKAKPVDIEVNNAALDQVLAQCFKGQPLTYTIKNNTVIIQRKKLTVPKENLLPATINGKVVDEKGNTLPGVSILIKGTKLGTTTNNDGAFTIAANKGDILVLSYMGFKVQEVTVGTTQSLTIVLVEDSKGLNEVVVTALGVKKEKKALGYSVAEVKGDELTQAREVNVANSLEGKVAGVNVTGLASGPGGSSRVVIRGSGSLSGNNQPLYVINGMPMDNTPSTTVTSNNTGFNVDKGDGIGGINPDDIETITVLKGGTASALYGSRASNGVILITTKKGTAQKGIGVEYNSTYTVETPALIPDWQYQYGEGFFGTKVTTQADAINFGRLSFGAKIDGSPVIQFDGVMRPYSAQKNNIKNFYNTGKTFSNTVAFKGGTDALNFRFSASDQNNKGIIPNNSLDKKIFNLSVNAALGKKITIEAVGQYNVENNYNRSSLGDALGNPNWATYMLANTVDVRSLSPGYDAKGNEVLWNSSGFATNPYFTVNRFQEKDTKNRFIGYGSVKYSILDNLFVKARVSQDYTGFNFTGITPTGTAFYPDGQFATTNSTTTETNSELTVNYNTQFLKDFKVNVLAGGNQQQHKVDETDITATKFNIPFFYSLTNVNTISTTPVYSLSAINSVFAAADFDYKSFAYLSITGRNDWFSTLSMKADHIFYPSVSGSFILSEVFRLPNWISYAKVRGSYAQVGGGAPNPYGINLTYSQVPGSGVPLQQLTKDVNGNLIIPNSSLKPYTSQTGEVGAEVKFLNNRLGLDLALYNRTTTNDIVPANIDPLSGFSFAYLNIGKINNKGIEVLLNGRPVKQTKFNWDVTYNFSYNKSMVKQLAAGQNSLLLSSAVNNYASVYAEVGKPYGEIKAYDIKRDARGNIMYAANGLEKQGNLIDMGTGVAPYAMGITNNFRYNRFNFSFLVDGKFGNKVFSGTNLYADRFGLLKNTLPGRDNGLTVTGVDNSDNPFTYTVPVSGVGNFYDNRKNISSFFVYDGSFIKLRQVILGYDVPVKNLKQVKIQSVNISFVARNLLILYKKTPNIDPESAFSAGNGQGLEMFGVPRTRSYGLNLMVKF